MIWTEYGGEAYRLGKGIRIDRKVSIGKGAGCFGLPKLAVRTFTAGGFVGDIAHGGSCNVRIMEMCPHNQTHIEMSEHVVSNGMQLSSLEDINGIMHLIDLSDAGTSGTIEMESLKVLERLPSIPPVIGIKTASSGLDEWHDFFGEDFLALSKEAASYIVSKGVEVLVLDLPSADREEDSMLGAHKAFFEGGGVAIMELAFFGSLGEGLYYFTCTPLRADVDAVATGAIVYHLQKMR